MNILCLVSPVQQYTHHSVHMIYLALYTARAHLVLRKHLELQVKRSRGFGSSSRTLELLPMLIPLLSLATGMNSGCG